MIFKIICCPKFISFFLGHLFLLLLLVLFISPNIWQSWDIRSYLWMKVAGMAYPCKYKGLFPFMGGWLQASLSWRCSEIEQTLILGPHPTPSLSDQAKMVRATSFVPKPILHLNTAINFFNVQFFEFSLRINTWDQELCILMMEESKKDGRGKTSTLVLKMSFPLVISVGPSWHLSFCLYACFQDSQWGTILPYKG